MITVARTGRARASSSGTERPGARALTAVTALAMIFPGCDSVTFVQRVTLVNETEYSINADVSGVRGGWLRLGSVSAHETLEMPEVIDQGSTWTFRFSYGNYEPVEVTVSEKDLADSDWQVEVPAELEERLREQGVPPPP